MISILITLISLTSFAQTPVPAPIEVPNRSELSYTTIESLPVLSGGRLKPFDSFARETVLFLTGSTEFENKKPTDFVFSLLTFPKEWSEKRFIKVSRKDLLKQLLLDETRSRFSPNELRSNAVVAQYAETAFSTNAQDKLATLPTGRTTGAQAPRDQELKRLVSRIGLFRSLVSGEALTLIPEPKPKAWLPLSIREEKAKDIQLTFAELAESYAKGDAPTFAAASVKLKEKVLEKMGRLSENDERTLNTEVLYNRARPFFYAMIFYFLAGLAGCFANYGIGKKLLLAFASTAFALHVFGFTLRCLIAGRPPVTNMYESILWVSGAAMAFSAVIYFFQRKPLLITVSSFLSGLFLVAAGAAPLIMDPNIHPLVPVLRSNYWLTIHVLTITAGYAAFALSLGISNVTLFHYLKQSLRNTDERVRIVELNQLSYRAVQFGVVLLAAGTILGGIWADESWGRFWGWDPKETWALIALLTYIAILHGRYAGWVTQFGFAVSTIVAFLSVLMAWYGVNFILGVGLHSYGFSSGGIEAVSVFTALQLTYVGVVALLFKSRALKTAL